jgi:hypothetical protein
MNQAMLTLSANAIKTQIIKQIRELDWSRERNPSLILQSVHNLEIATLARTNESQQFSALMVYNQMLFNDLNTQNKFRELLQMYKAIMPRSAQDMTRILSSESENKTIDLDVTDEEIMDGFFELEEDEYNPLAAAHNDHMTMLDVKNDLDTIDRKMNLDWVAASEVRTDVVKPAVEPSFDVISAEEIIYPEKSKSNPTHYGKLIGLAVGVLIATAIMIFVPPAIPFIAILLYGTASTTAASIVTSLFVTAICTLSFAVGAAIDYAKNKLSRKQPKVSVINDNAIETITEEKQIENVITEEPQNDNIHQDPDMSEKESVDVNMSQSRYSQFHKTTTAAVKPIHILVKNFSSRR